MNLFQNRYWVYNFAAIVGITIVTGYFVVQQNMSSRIETAQYVNLSNADIERIMSVKTEMQEAKIQADLDN